jgi:hypothetical protein
MKSWPNVKKLVDICVFSLPNENKFPKRIGSSAAMAAARNLVSNRSNINNAERRPSSKTSAIETCPHLSKGPRLCLFYVFIIGS